MEITVALAENPEFQDSVILQVGGCSCQITVAADGIAGAPTEAWFYLNDDRTGFSAFGWGGNGTNGTIGLADDSVVPFGTTGSFEGRGTGLVSLTQGGFANSESLDEPLPPLTIVIAENNGGNVLAGSVSGTVALIQDPPQETFPFSMSFRIEADPMWSSERERVCRTD
ncbi:MAG: hypothetical protein WEA34_08505 [Gemmatimonadota bacterium]